MSTTQFAMVEELASLIKDNLPSKHLVLAVEEALVNYLQSDASPGVLELEPMSSYDRLLLHRLADIFGFAHGSVGEGDDRHLILERCPETSIPSILVSDFLWQHDVSHQAPSTTYQLLRREDASAVIRISKPSPHGFFAERKAAYLAARERIFSMGDGGCNEDVKQKPRHVPVVARRMIAHALGQRINPTNPVNDSNNEESDKKISDHNIPGVDKVDPKLHMETSEEKTNKCLSSDKRCLDAEDAISGRASSTLGQKKLLQKEAGDNSFRDGCGISRISMKEENVGAAKRMFAHALGLHSAKDGLTKSREFKPATDQ